MKEYEQSLIYKNLGRNHTSLNKYYKQKTHKMNSSNNLIQKCQMRYNSFLKENKDVTMVGTKRYDDKSGEYYLLNSEKLHKNNSNFLLQKYNTKPNLTNIISISYLD